MADINVRPPRSPKAHRINELLIYFCACLAASEQLPTIEADLEYNYNQATVRNGMPHPLSQMLGPFGGQILMRAIIRLTWAEHRHAPCVSDLATVIYSICTEIVSEYALPKDNCSLAIFMEATRVKTIAARLKGEAGGKHIPGM